MLVGGRDAGAGVDHEEDDVGLGDGHLGLPAHARFKAIAGDVLEAGGVEQAEAQIADAALALAAVAGDARRVVDQRDAPAHQPVEQRRFADIGPADNGDGDGHCDDPRRYRLVPARTMVSIRHVSICRSRRLTLRVCAARSASPVPSAAPSATS